MGPLLNCQGELALVPCRGAGANRRALGIELGVNRLAYHRVACIASSLHDRPLGKQLVNGGNGTQAAAHLGRHGFAVAHEKPFDMFNKKLVPRDRHRANKYRRARKRDRSIMAARDKTSKRLV